jgi:hypothetical protein
MINAKYEHSNRSSEDWDPMECDIETGVGGSIAKTEQECLIHNGYHGEINNSRFLADHIEREIGNV